MEPLMYVMAILGCGESEAPCEVVTTVESRYASEAECLQATENELMRRTDILFPAVVAQCRPAGEGPQLLRGSEVRLPVPETGRHAAPRFARNEVRTGRH